MNIDQCPEPLHLPEVDSTNSYARAHYGELADATLVYTFDQTAGRGRCGRKWVAPPGRCFAGTAVFKNLREGFHGGAILAVAALEVLRVQAPSLRAYFKWPNDLYVRELKLGGMLGEGVEFRNGKVTGGVAGLGLNINLDRGELDRIAAPATSMQSECGQKFDLEKFVAQLAKELWKCYIIYSNSPQELLCRWREANLLIGSELTVSSPDGRKFFGRFAAVDEAGAMLLEQSGGKRLRFDCGDVHLERETLDFASLEQKLDKINQR